MQSNTEIVECELKNTKSGIISETIAKISVKFGRNPESVGKTFKLLELAEKIKIDNGIWTWIR